MKAEKTATPATVFPKKEMKGLIHNHLQHKDSDFEWIYELFVIVFSVVFTLIMYIL